MKVLLIILLSVSLAAGASMLVLTGNVTSTVLASYTTTFPGANENPLSEGGKWDAGVGSTDNAKLDTNDAQGPGSGLFSVCRLTTPAFNNNQKSTITLKTLLEVAPTVRIQGSSDPASYYAYLASTTSVQIYKTDSTFTSFPTIGAAYTVATLVAGDTLGLSASGTSTTTLEVFVNGVSQGTRTDSSSPLTGGQPGMMIQNNSRVDAYSATDL